MYEIIQFIDRNLIYTVLGLVCLMATYGVSTIYRIRKINTIMNTTNETKKEVDVIAKEQKSIKLEYENDKKKRLKPYTELTNVYDRELKFLNDSSQLPENVIDFLFSKLGILIQLTKFLHSLDYFNISERSINENIKIVREDIYSNAVRYISSNFAKINKNANNNIFINSKYKLFQILNDKTGNNKQERIIELMKCLTAETLHISVNSYKGSIISYKPDIKNNIKNNKITIIEFIQSEIAENKPINSIVDLIENLKEVNRLKYSDTIQQQLTILKSNFNELKNKDNSGAYSQNIIFENNNKLKNRLLSILNDIEM